jgi:hypothetical protein
MALVPRGFHPIEARFSTQYVEPVFKSTQIFAYLTIFMSFRQKSLPEIARLGDESAANFAARRDEMTDL